MAWVMCVCGGELFQNQLDVPLDCGERILDRCSINEDFLQDYKNIFKLDKES